MTRQAPSNPVPAILLRTRESFILHQTLYVAAKLGEADRPDGDWRSTAELARELKVNEDALYRALRLRGIFVENSARCFRNTEISNFLRTRRARLHALALHLLGQRLHLSLLWPDHEWKCFLACLFFEESSDAH